jgi:isochorismate pyruvate lyase
MSDPNPDPHGPPLWGEGPSTSLAEIRAEIDRIDAALVTLLAERTRFTREAGRFKASLAQVTAPARIDDVIAKVLTRAAAAGLPASIAEPVWRTLITTATEDQRQLFLAHAPDHLKR